MKLVGISYLLLLSMYGCNAMDENNILSMYEFSPTNKGKNISNKMDEEISIGLIKRPHDCLEQPYKYYTKTGIPVVFDSQDQQAVQEGMSELLIAAKDGHNIVVEFLAGKGHDINQENKQGVTAFLYAAQWGNLPFMEKCKDLKANIHHADKYGNNALVYAISNIFAFRKLLEWQVDHLHQNKEGKTPLQVIQEKMKDNPDKHNFIRHLENPSEALKTNL